MAKIFISYSRNDSAIVDNIHNRLSASGFDIWLDRDNMQGGDLWKRQIVEAISTCLAFVIILSPNSIQSINVRKELDLAEGKGRRIVPIMIVKTGIPAEMEYQLAGVQIIDLSKNWETGLNRLIESLGIQKVSAAAPIFSPANISQSPQPSSATGTIRLARFNEKGYSGGELGKYGIWLDDKKVGTLAYGKEISLIVPPGIHQIFVEWMSFKSNRLQFTVNSYETSKLVCGEKQGLFLGSLFVKVMDY